MSIAATPHLPRNAPVARNHELGMDRRPRVECPPINPYVFPPPRLTFQPREAVVERDGYWVRREAMKVA